MANTITTADTVGAVAGVVAFGAVVAHGGATLVKHKIDTIKLEKKEAEAKAAQEAAKKPENEGGNR